MTLIARITALINVVASDIKNLFQNKQDILQSVTGNVGVGKTNASATEKIDVNGNVKATGFKTPTGTATQALTANGGTFDLTTKADLVGGKIPTNQLPSYVDDVLEFANLVSFPATGESGKIYIAIDTNLTYRWGGSSYVVMSSSLELGETSSTAYRGDRGKTAYDHSQAIGNPHNTTKSDIGLGNVDNTSDLNKPISNATQTALNSKENISNKQNNLNADATNTKYPTVTAINSGLATKLDKGTYTGTAQDLKNAIDGKANASHSHNISEVTGLQNILDNKQDKITHGTSTPTGGNDGDIYLQHQ